MGTWGTAIFSDDLASDIRGDWKDAIANGLSPEEATKQLLEKHEDSIRDPDEGPRVWFALAAVQAATGRLQPEVRNRALDLIDRGGDVPLFASDDAKLGAKRAEVLARLAALLRGPQKAPTKLVQPKPRKSPVAIGDLLRVRAGGGPARYFLVTGLTDGWPPGTEWPVMVGFLWDKDRDPTPEEVDRLPFLRDTDGLDRIRKSPQGPVIDVITAIGPSRGPRAWNNFATVIASGIRRADAPDHTTEEKRGFRVGAMSWETLGQWSSGDWYPRVAALTVAALEMEQKSQRRWPWRRKFFGAGPC